MSSKIVARRQVILHLFVAGALPISFMLTWSPYTVFGVAGFLACAAAFWAIASRPDLPGQGQWTFSNANLRMACQLAEWPLRVIVSARLLVFALLSLLVLFRVGILIHAGQFTGQVD